MVHCASRIAPPPGSLNGPLPDRPSLGRLTFALGMILLSTGCGSGAVAPSDEPELTASRQQAPAPPERPVLANLRSAEWAQAHGLPINPHRGDGPSITFYGPNGTIRRHVAVSEASLRPPPRETRAGFALLPASFEGNRWQLEEASSPNLVRQGVLTDSVVTIGSTEQLWVFEDGVLIAKSINVLESDTLIGGSELAFDEFGEVTSEVWVPRSSMGGLDPEDPEWEIGFASPGRPIDLDGQLASCVVLVTSDDCATAIADAVVAAAAFAPHGWMCAKFRLSCEQARQWGSIFVTRVIIAIAVCSEGEWETMSPLNRRGSTTGNYPIHRA